VVVQDDGAQAVKQRESEAAATRCAKLKTVSFKTGSHVTPEPRTFHFSPLLGLVQRAQHEGFSTSDPRDSEYDISCSSNRIFWPKGLMQQRQCV
jgi:hypothetical protein